MNTKTIRKFENANYTFKKRLVFLPRVTRGLDKMSSLNEKSTKSEAKKQE